MVKEAYKFAAPPVALGLVALVPGWTWLSGAFISAGLFVLFFFRDPERIPPADPDAVLSPADGRVVEIVEEPYEGRPGRRVSIFLSIWDVHVNRVPIDGQIRKVEYRPGRFYAALRSRASTENEQNVIRIAARPDGIGAGGEIVCKQIAGWIARRVLCWKAEGDVVTRGERLGMIRFGSRMDLWLPAEAEIVVRRGRHVAGGTSILARWKAV